MLKVVTMGDPILHQTSQEVDKIDNGVKDLVKEMFQTMYFSNGIGLAAVQVGVLKRIVVVDVPDHGKYTLINPKIIDKSADTIECEEGCLSIPGIAENVVRSNEVVVEFLDIKNKKQKLKADGLLAVCIQHELDHLDGVLFIDRLTPEKRMEKIKEYKNLKIV